MSSYAGIRGEALPWGLVLMEGIVVALFGLILLVDPGASLFFLSDPLWSATLASAWLVVLVGFLAMLQGAAGALGQATS